MAFERLKAEIGILLTEMQNEPADKHELAQQVHAKLQELRAFGMPLPKDLTTSRRRSSCGVPGGPDREAPRQKAGD